MRAGRRHPATRSPPAPAVPGADPARVPWWGRRRMPQPEVGSADRRSQSCCTWRDNHNVLGLVLFPSMWIWSENWLVRKGPVDQTLQSNRRRPLRSRCARRRDTRSFTGQVAHAVGTRITYTSDFPDEVDVQSMRCPPLRATLIPSA